MTLCDCMDCSLPGSFICGVFQARILEWVAISFSRGSSRPRDQTRISSLAGRFFTTEPPVNSERAVLPWPPDPIPMFFPTKLYSPWSQIAFWSSERLKTNSFVQKLIASRVFHENHLLSSGIVPDFCFVLFSISGNFKCVLWYKVMSGLFKFLREVGCEGMEEVFLN